MMRQYGLFFFVLRNTYHSEHRDAATRHLSHIAPCLIIGLLQPPHAMYTTVESWDER